MASRRSAATATKSTPKKSISRATKSDVIISESVTKYTHAPREIPMTDETNSVETTEAQATTKKRARPEKTNLTYVDYIEDAKVRWAIHSYEVAELWDDMVGFYHFSSPYVVKAYASVSGKVQELVAKISEDSSTNKEESPSEDSTSETVETTV